MMKDDSIKSLPLKSRLKIYLNYRGITQTAFAAELSCKQSFFSVIMSKKSSCPPKLAKEIERLTEGLITVGELVTPIGKRCPTCGHKLPKD